MVKLLKIGVPVLFGVALLGLAAWYLSSHQLAVLTPAGPVAAKERSLLLLATGLMLIVVVPVFVLTFGIAWHYRAGNAKATYTPDWDHNRQLEAAWWGIPCALIGVLAVITWTSSHELDPAKPLVSTQPPLTVQVVALQWKWLFIYPQQKLATVNYLELPTGTPVDFEITSDAPMNSFWIPQLSGQIYAMSGMTTHLNVQADQVGAYRGVSANLSGQGFAGMNFLAHAVTPDQFTNWAASARAGSGGLDEAGYKQLASPSENAPIATYTLADSSLYDTVMAKYMGSDAHTAQASDGMAGMNMAGTGQ